jgi:hypothetical protein
MFWILAIILCLGSVCSAQAPQSTQARQSTRDPFECVEEFFIPAYTSLARNAGSRGTALVHLRFSSGAADISVSGVTADLEASVLSAMKRSTFRKSCVGKGAEFTFQFMVEVGGGTIGNPMVSFAPPNKFIIRVAPGPINLAAPK